MQQRQSEVAAVQQAVFFFFFVSYPFRFAKLASYKLACLVVGREIGPLGHITFSSFLFIKEIPKKLGSRGKTKAVNISPLLSEEDASSLPGLAGHIAAGKAVYLSFLNSNS